MQEIDSKIERARVAKTREKGGQARKGWASGRETTVGAKKLLARARISVENREKLVIKARERREKKWRKKERQTERKSDGQSDGERVGAGDESWRVGSGRVESKGSLGWGGAAGGMRVAQENAWKCIPRSGGVPVAKPKDREKRAKRRGRERGRRAGTGRCDRGRDWDAEDIIRVEKPRDAVTEKLCLILPTGPAPAIVILHFAELRFFPSGRCPSFEGFALARHSALKTGVCESGARNEEHRRR